MKNSSLILINILFPCCLFAQTIATVTGNGLIGNTGDGGLAISAQISYPVGGVFDKQGNYYFATSSFGNSIRKITPTGIIYTVAGTGIAGFSGDNGPATAAQLRTTQGVAIDTLGNLYIADAHNNRIRKVNVADGVITTVVGTGVGGVGGDGGPATAADIQGPLDVCFDKSGNLYIADNVNGRVRKVSPAGIITTFAGTGVLFNSTGGGLADTTPIVGASGLCTDDTGNVYIANWHSRVYKIDTFGIIRTIVGTGVSGYSGDGGIATNAQTIPNKIAIDKLGNIYIAEYDLHRVRKVNNSGLIATITGNGIASFSGDGMPAIGAQVNYPSGVTIDACGNLHISDGRNHRIRKVSFNTPTTPTVTMLGTATATIGSIVTINATIANAGISYLVRWMNKGILFATTTVPTVMYTKAAGTDTITARIVPAITYCYDSTTSAPHMVAVSSVGIAEVGGMGGYSIYPNPALHILTVSGTEVVNTVAITNLLGQVLLTREFGKNTIQVNIAHLPPGMYLIRVNDVWVTRFVKE